MPWGIGVTPALIARKELPKIPRGLPMNKPKKIPVETAIGVASDAPPAPIPPNWSGTAQFAGANSGRINKALHLDQPWARCSKTFLPLLETIGTQKAISTPAMSALMPLFKRQYHMATAGKIKPFEDS